MAFFVHYKNINVGKFKCEYLKKNIIKDKKN